MIANKPLHALLGITMFVAGLVCLISDIPPRGPYYLILIFFGLFWAIVPGHLALLLEPLIRKIAFPFAFPFLLARYYTKSPVRYKNGQPVDNYGWPVLAYHEKGDHIFLVAGPKPIPLSSSSSILPFAYEEYRHNTVIEKTIEVLNGLDVPEVSIDIPLVDQSLQKILRDPCLEDCFGFSNQTVLSYNPDLVVDYFHRMELYFRRFPKQDEWIVEKFLKENRISICTLKVWCRFIKKDPFWSVPQTTMDKILYKWWS